MFEVYIVNEDFTSIHNPSTTGVKLTSMNMVREINTIPIFDFSFLPDNPADALLRLRITRIRIIRTKDRKEIFEGRVVDYNGEIDTENKRSKSYTAEDMLGVLNDSRPPHFTFKGRPSELVRKLLEHHNRQVEPWKQFQLGDCEVDNYHYYPDSTEVEEDTNITLSIGDNATIKAEAQYIWDDNGTRYNMAPSVKGVTHTVDAVGSTGVFKDKYRLRHPIPAWGVSGWVLAEDIAEVKSYTTSNGVSTMLMNTMATNTGGERQIPKNTKVMIKDSATSYYWDSYSTSHYPILSYIRNSTNLTVIEYNNNRYALYDNGTLVAWISANDLITGSTPVEPSTPDKPDSLVKNRIIEVEITGGTTLDNVFEHVIDSVGGEIMRTRVEGVNTLNIYNEISRESDTPIEFYLNLQELQESIESSEIITKLRPVGIKPKTEEDTATASVRRLAQTLGSENNETTSPTYLLGGG